MATENIEKINSSQNHIRARIRSKLDLLLVFGIYLSIFISSYVFFQSPFEFYFGYLIYLLLLPYLIKKFGINKNIFYIFLLLLLNGLIMIFLGFNSPALFFKVFLGLMASYIFYDNIIRLFEFDLDTLFRWYLKGALWVSYIGAFQAISWLAGFEKGYTLFGIFNKWGVIPGGIIGIRINSVFSEPTYFGAFIAGAFFTAVYTLLPITKYSRPYYRNHEAVTIIIIYFLTSSGLAQNGIFLSIILLLFNFGFIRYVLIFIPLLIISFNIIYNNVKDFRERMDSLIELYLYNKFVLGKTHGSSFILYNNYHVATDNFWNNPLFGTGIGSHPVAFEKYSRAKHIKVKGFEYNSADANSMLLRLISETGLFGTGIFLFLTFKGFVRRSSGLPDSFWVISSSCLIIILLNLFRQGHYFLNGFPFYFLLYIYNKVKHQEACLQKFIDTGKFPIK